MCSSAEDEMALQGMVIDGTAGQLVQALKCKGAITAFILAAAALP